MPLPLATVTSTLTVGRVVVIQTAGGTVQGKVTATAFGLIALSDTSFVGRQHLVAAADVIAITTTA